MASRKPRHLVRTTARKQRDAAFAKCATHHRRNGLVSEEGTTSDEESSDRLSQRGSLDSRSHNARGHCGNPVGERALEALFANGCKCLKINGSFRCGRVAQLGEHLLCKQGVGSSNLLTSTKFLFCFDWVNCLLGLDREPAGSSASQKLQIPKIEAQILWEVNPRRKIRYAEYVTLSCRI